MYIIFLNLRNKLDLKMPIFPPQNQFEKWKGNFKPCWKILNFTQKNAESFLFKLFEYYQEKNAVFLYSGKTGRYSFFAKNPFQTFEYKNQKSFFNQQEKKENPIQVLRQIFSKFKAPKIKELPPFYCGAIGMFSYEAFALFENIPKSKINDLKIPEIQLNFYDEVVVFDHLKSKLFIVGCAREYGEAKRKVEKMEKKIKFSLRGLEGVKPKVEESFSTTFCYAKASQRFAQNHTLKNQFTSNFTPDKYAEAIQKIKKYLIQGDTFQVNLSQRLEAELKIPSAEIFKIMMQINPSPFSVYFNGGDFQIVSSSPERLIRLHNAELFTQPIAGTRKRGKNTKEDFKLAQELKNSSKEMAEHTMLVDLERNDLGKVSEHGSVVTKKFAHIEKYSHVQHLVSNIYGKIQKGKDFFDVLRAVFPGGTITGAPKIRTMEIISELESTQRGPYTGSIGYIGFNGNFDLNILIRTIVCANQKMYIQVGGGIVMDSKAEKEYQETLDKAKAMLEAVA